MAKGKRQKPEQIQLPVTDATENVSVLEEQPTEVVQEETTETPEVDSPVAEPVIETATAEVKIDPHAHVISTGSIVFTGNADATENVSVSNVVKIKIKYPDNYRGVRRLTNGKLYDVSKGTAEILVAKGIASIIE